MKQNNIKLEDELKRLSRILPLNVRVKMWPLGRDTGTSSLTIYRTFALTENKTTDKYFLTMDMSNGYFWSPPQDSADFGRCRRLLLFIPEWRTSLSHIVEKHPQWKRWVDAWDRMDEIYTYCINSAAKSKTLGSAWEPFNQLQLEIIEMFPQK